MSYQLRCDVIDTTLIKGCVSAGYSVSVFSMFKISEFTVMLVLLNKLNRGSYMSAHVLLNLLKEVEKRDKM